MSGLNRTWQSICRFIARTDATVVTETEEGRAGSVHQCRGTLETLRDEARQLTRFYRRLREQMRESQLDPELSCREVMRKERRAKRRSLVLLLKLLSPEQRREFRERRYFHVTGGSSGDRYRIRIDMIANIDVLCKDGKVRHRLCVRPFGDVPIYDVMAAQLLHLQEPGAEYAFLRMANIHSTLPEDQLCLRTMWIS